MVYCSAILKLIAVIAMRRESIDSIFGQHFEKFFLKNISPSITFWCSFIFLGILLIQNINIIITKDLFKIKKLHSFPPPPSLFSFSFYFFPSTEHCSLIDKYLTNLQITRLMTSRNVFNNRSFKKDSLLTFASPRKLSYKLLNYRLAF